MKRQQKQFLLKDLKISSNQYLKSQTVPPENGPREKNNKAANGGVFKVGDLQLARSDEDKRDDENDGDYSDDYEDGDDSGDGDVEEEGGEFT